MRRLVATAVLIGALLAPAAASAHHSPPNCSSNEFKLTLGRDRPSGIYANGELITYSVKVSNVGATTCDITGVTLVLRLPAADGTPRGTAVTIASNADYRAGFDERTIAQVPYKLAVNPGVVDAVAQVDVAAAVLHDLDNDHPHGDYKQIGTTVVKPTLLLDKTGSTNGGVGPQNVEYTYAV